MTLTEALAPIIAQADELPRLRAGLLDIARRFPVASTTTTAPKKKRVRATIPPPSIEGVQRIVATNAGWTLPDLIPVFTGNTRRQVRKALQDARAAGLIRADGRRWTVALPHVPSLPVPAVENARTLAP